MRAGHSGHHGAQGVGALRLPPDRLSRDQSRDGEAAPADARREWPGLSVGQGPASVRFMARRLPQGRPMRGCRRMRPERQGVFYAPEI